MRRQRVLRGALVVLGTLAFLALALIGPALARGDAWLSARWMAWPGPLESHPSFSSTLGWLGLVGWCVALVATLAALPYLVWRMTLGADTRVPRLGLPTVAPLMLGPRGWRTSLRDVPGMLRGAALVMAARSAGESSTSRAATFSSR